MAASPRGDLGLMPPSPSPAAPRAATARRHAEEGRADISRGGASGGGAGGGGGGGGGDSGGGGGMDEDGADLGAQPAASWLAMMGEGVRPQTAPAAKHRHRPPVWVSSSWCPGSDDGSRPCPLANTPNDGSRPSSRSSRVISPGPGCYSPTPSGETGPVGGRAWSPIGTEPPRVASCSGEPVWAGGGRATAPARPGATTGGRWRRPCDPELKSSIAEGPNQSNF